MVRSIYRFEKPPAIGPVNFHPDLSLDAVSLCESIALFDRKNSNEFAEFIILLQYNTLILIKNNITIL